MRKNDDFEFLTVPEKYSGLDPISYQYFDKLLNQRTIVFNDEVCENILENVILPLQKFEKDENEDTVTLILQTAGGSVLDGFVLCNIIDNYKKKLNIIVYGYAMSMGLIFLAAGAKNPNVKKYCYPHSFALLHAGTVAITASEAKTALDVLNFNERVDKMVRDYIIDNTTFTEEEYTNNERKQVYLTASEMKERHLVDYIIGEDVSEVV